MLSHSGQNYKLEFPFVDHSYDNLVIDDAEVRVILPEGARLVSFNDLVSNRYTNIALNFDLVFHPMVRYLY